MFKLLALIVIHCVFIHGLCVDSVHAQQQQQPSLEGEFEISVKGLPGTTIRFEQLVVDRDQDKVLNEMDGNRAEKKYLYRTETAGFMGFSQSEWVDEIKFKVTDRPDIGSKIYKEYSELLSQIGERMWLMKVLLGNYYKPALRAISMCGEGESHTPEAVDSQIQVQLNNYYKLKELQTKVVAAIANLREGEPCKALLTQYRKMMESYSKSLLDLSEGYDTLKRKVEAVGGKLNQRDSDMPLGK